MSLKDDLKQTRSVSIFKEEIEFQMISIRWVLEIQHLLI